MEEFHNANVHSLVLDLLTHNINSTTATYHHMTRKFDRFRSFFRTPFIVMCTQSVAYFQIILIH